MLDRHIVNVNDIDKIKKVSDIKNIFYGDYKDYINFQFIKDFALLFIDIYIRLKPLDIFIRILINIFK